MIPGLDIASSALAMARGVTEVATAGMRQRETDISMFEARAGSGEKVNVMVYPLMKVSQVYTKHLEQQCWSLGVSIINFSTSVAQVASAGGFGVPAAIKAATAVIDNLHNIAHYIAEQGAQPDGEDARRRSPPVMHLEGGAEDELKKHPKMAVDGIIMKAAAGDKTAQQFLSNYRIDGKPITPDYVAQIKPRPVKPFNPKAKPDDKEEQTSNDALLLKIRAVVLEGMDTNADPQSVFEDLQEEGQAGHRRAQRRPRRRGPRRTSWRTKRNEQAKRGQARRQQEDRPRPRLAHPADVQLREPRQCSRRGPRRSGSAEKPCRRASCASSATCSSRTSRARVEIKTVHRRADRRGHRGRAQAHAAPQPARVDRVPARGAAATRPPKRRHRRRDAGVAGVRRPGWVSATPSGKP